MILLVYSKQKEMIWQFFHASGIEESIFS